MKTQLGVMLLAASALCGQSAAPGWQEFFIGPPKEGRMTFSNNGIRAARVSLKTILSRAYDIREDQIAGPDWLSDERYELTAVVADPAQFQPLMQKELAKRGRLVAHRETKNVPVYVLKSLRGPVKLPDSPGNTVVSRPADADGMSTYKWTHSSMSQVASSLADVAGRPVFDETHVEGKFDSVLRWKCDSVPALKAAVKEQLGLELVEESRPVDLLVIDRIEKLQFAK
jgi:uncharacterized protein (TIGR03435 family)